MAENTLVGHSNLNIADIPGLMKHKISLDEAAINSIQHCRNYLDKKVDGEDELIYGINTGFGYLCDVAISKSQLAELQYNLVVSHACGVGKEVPSSIVKLMLLLKVVAFSKGHSGVSLATTQRLVDMYNEDILPVVFDTGSLGASGDLAPLAHISLPLLGLGEVFFKGQRMSSKEALQKLQWEPIELQSKEGLALLNGTQFMSAYGVSTLIKSSRILEMANLLGALSLDALHGKIDPFHDAIHRIRGQHGQRIVAEKIRDFLSGSKMAHGGKQSVQDPYCLRCIPQVHGASHDVIDHVKGIFEREINAVTDNPNVFPEEDLILSGGNFHGQPLAMGLDYLAIGLAEIGSISERRCFKLVSGMRGLPLFLVKEAGLHSGMMIPQYAAAALVSKNKQLCTPASIDSIDSSNGQEDHVSMGANAATKCYQIAENVESVLAIELLLAAQAIEFRRPAKTSERLEELLQAYRQEVSFIDKDRVLHDDIEKSRIFISQYQGL